MFEHVPDDELDALLRRYLDEAHSAPKAGPEFVNVSQNVVFAPVSRAIEVREEMRRRGLTRNPESEPIGGEG